MCSKQISNTIDVPLERSPLLTGLFLAGSGQLTTDPGYRGALQTRSELRVYYVSSGSGIFAYGGKEYPVRQHDLFFQRPEQEAGFRTGARMAAEVWWIDLYGPGAGELARQLPLDRPAACGVPDPRFLQEFRGIAAYNGRLSPADALHLQSGLYKICGMLLEECTTSQWTIVPHDDPRILYTGGWVAWPSPFGEDHEEYYTAAPRAYAEYNFCGTGVKWIGTMNFDCGKADVILDGVYQATVDAYSPVRLSKQLLYINTKLQYGKHIIKVFCTGERNDKAANCDVVVESFQSLDLQEEAPGGPGASTRLGRKVAEAIRESYARPLTVDQLAAMAGVSRSYLTVRFTEEMGMAPSRYLTQVRLGHAKELLRATDLPVSQVAAMVGYPDVFYFSRLFKREEKVTPSQYRQLNRPA